MTAEQIGELEDLGDGKHRPLGGLLIASPADPAGVTRQDLVLIHGGGEDRPEQPVSLCCHRDRHS
jgi:hypothetical protein